MNENTLKEDWIPLAEMIPEENTYGCLKTITYSFGCFIKDKAGKLIFDENLPRDTKTFWSAKGKVRIKAPVAEQPMQEKKDVFLTVRQFCEKHSFIKHGGLRALIFHASANGFDKCLQKMGRKVLVNEKLFFEWMKENTAERKARTCYAKRT